MLLAAMDMSLHRALKHAKEVFNVVCCEAFFVHIFAALMFDGLMLGVSRTRIFIELAFVRNQSGLAVNIGEQDVANSFGLEALLLPHMESAGFA